MQSVQLTGRTSRLGRHGALRLHPVQAGAVALATFLAAATAHAGPDIKDCRPGETVEMAQAIDWGAAHWKEFESFLEREADVSIKNCLEQRFKKNGRVVCEKDMDGMCSTRKGNNNAWASPFNKRAHICPDFTATMRGKSGPTNKNNRMACYFALITHEWAHTCERTHKSIERIDDAAFDFWKLKHADVSFNLTNCKMD